MHPTQRRLLFALIVTLACLPLLVIDVLQGSTTTSASEASTTSSDSSLVVALAPVVEETTTTTLPTVVPVPEVVTVPTTASPATVVPRSVSPAPSTTTTVPQVPVTSTPSSQTDEEFLACVRWRESRGNYGAADRTGTFLGAYQIYQGGWDSVAAQAGRFDLVGVPPNQASPSDQDAIAFAMLRLHGRSPWGGSCG